jgi:IS5 family transposase
VEARWTKKGSQTHYGYKNHIHTDVKYKLIRDYEGKPVSTHDSTVFEQILDPDNHSKDEYADSAYSGADK